MNKIRINKYLAKSGLGSRRECEKYVVNGNIKVNGETIHDLSYMVDLNSDEVLYNGEIVRPEESSIYLMMNKPAGYLCSKHDKFHKKNVYQLLKAKQDVFSVGRLDLDAEGLLLFTNDGEFANQLAHPRYKIRKKYLISVTGGLNNDKIEKLEEGIELEEGITGRCHIDVINAKKDKVLLYITIYQGWKRQIKRMFKAVGHRVLSIKRVEFGNLKLGDLPSGKTRKLTDKEISSLKRLVRKK